MAQPNADGKRKWVYAFVPGKAEGSAQMSELLGGKGANLAEMAALGLPVPPGFTITTEVCEAFFAAGHKLPEELKGEVMQALDAVGQTVSAKFGDENRPLLIS
ncbi:MAG TPA: PEP/pyruvate-binding domain-containing protein, partial [Hyphomicrobium sp.]|nr:PEP/pyruvate-binding domain-containing protein [Hyphomicrobium sp.]